MSVTKGSDFGGIRDLAGVRDRCVVDDATGCWHWRGCFYQGDPALWVVWPDGARGKSKGLRAALQLKLRQKLPADQVVFRSACCPNADCVAPSHAVVGTRRDASKAASSRGSFSAPWRRAALAEASAARQKLSPQQRMDIATSSTPTPELATQYGVTRERVNSIRRGNFGNQRSPATSVFEWRPA